MARLRRTTGAPGPIGSAGAIRSNRPSQRSSARRVERWTGYLFVLPLLVLVGVFTFFPVGFSFYISLFHWDPFEHAVYFVGLRNYEYVLTSTQIANPSFDFSVLNVLFYTAIVVPIQTVVAFLLALLFNTRTPTTRVARAIVFIPAATSSVAMSALFIWVFSYQGPVNAALAPLGFSPLNWFNDPRVAFYAIMAMNIFTTAPYFMIVYAAGLQTIPTSILEAASLDGVRSLWHRTRYVYFPMLRFMTALVLILGLVGCIQLFDQVFVITGGGPAGSTYVPLMYVYANTFLNQGTQGVAAAASFILFVVIFAIAFTQRRLFKDIRWAG